MGRPSYTIPFVRQADGGIAPSELANGMMDWIEYLANYGYNTVVASRCTTAAPSVPNSSLDPVELPTVEVDTESNSLDHLGMCLTDTLANRKRIYIRVAGIYLVGGQVIFSGSAAGTTRGGYVRLNGTEYITSQAQLAPSGANTASVNCATQRYLSVGDYIELPAFQNTGGALALSVVSSYTPATRLYAFRVGNLIS